jgi:hypothetical protein
MPRLQDLKHFYASLRILQKGLGGAQSLSAEPFPVIPRRGGIYFFFEPGEDRTHSGSGPRVVRVGKAANLRARLYSHHGALSLTGPTEEGWHPHFHWYVQDALQEKHDSSAASTRSHQRMSPAAVNYLARMTFHWLPVEDPIERERLETNAIRLLTNYEREPIDPPSRGWLGHWALKTEIQGSHLWNVNGVKSHLSGVPHELDLLVRLRTLVQTTDLY